MVRGCSRSLKTAPFDRPHTTFCYSTIVNIGLSATIFELFGVESYSDLEIWVRGHSKSLKLVKFKSLGTVSYSPSIVTMALSCIISEIKQVIGQILRFFYIHVYSTPQLVVSHQNIARPFGTEN